MNPHNREAEQVDVPDDILRWMNDLASTTGLSKHQAAALWFYLHGKDLGKLSVVMGEPEEKLEGWLDSALVEYEKARWLTAYVESAAGGPPEPQAPEYDPEVFEEFR